MIQLKLIVQSVVANVRIELIRDLIIILLNNIGDVNKGYIPSIN